MAIPRNVQRQGDRAELIRKKVYEEGKTPKELGLNPETPPGEAPPNEPDPIIPPIEEGRETPPVEDYKTKYEEALHQVSVLKGKIDSEVPDLVSTNRTMAGQIANLQTTISDLQAKFNKDAEEPTISKPDPKETEELQSYLDNYPEIHRGQIIVMKQWVKSDEFKDMVSSIVDGVINSTMEPRVASVEKDVKKTAEQTFEGKLDGLVKDENGKSCWRQINDDAQFTAWLKNQKYGGFTKIELLRGALSRGDVEAVAEFFTEWQALKKPPAKPSKEEPPIDDESLTPSRPGGSQLPRVPAGGDGKPKTFTRTFVKKFHTDVALGRYKNKPKDRERITAEINEAMTKGLIINE